MTVPAEVLALWPAIERVRALADEQAATAIAVTWRTLDGEVAIDYRRGDYLRVTFTGDASARTYVLPPDFTVGEPEEDLDLPFGPMFD